MSYKNIDTVLRITMPLTCGLVGFQLRQDATDWLWYIIAVLLLFAVTMDTISQRRRDTLMRDQEQLIKDQKGIIDGFTREHNL